MKQKDFKTIQDFINLCEEEIDEEYVHGVIFSDDNLNKPLKQIVLELIERDFIGMYKDIQKDRRLFTDERVANEKQLDHWYKVKKHYKAFLLEKNI